MQAIKITNLDTINENIISQFMTFKSPFTWSVTSGTGLGTNSTEQYSSGTRSLKITNSAYRTTDITVSATGQNTGFVLTTDKNICFSFKAFNPTQSATDQVQELSINIFKDGSPFEVLDFTVDEFNKWITYGQYLSLSSGTYSMTFTQKFNGTSSLFSCFIYLDDFKFEVDNLGNGYPTGYVEPKTPISNGGGWGYYVDSLATPTIVVGTSYTQITIDALGANITTYLPDEIKGVSELVAGGKITPINIGDDYDGRLDIAVTSKTGSPSLIEFIIDFGAGAGGTNKAYTGYINTAGSTPYEQTLILDFYTLATFKANGGRIFMKTDTGSVTIGKRNIKLSRKAK